MAPHAEKSRRKSLSLLSRASLSSLSQINTDVGHHNGKEDKEHKDKKKSGKRASIFGSLAPTINTEPENGTTTGSPVKNDTLHSPNVRPRTLQKGRPSSLFGSLGRRSMTDLDEEKEVIGMTPESP